jgi:hypothetical protein
MIGGIPSLTAVLVILTGITGAIIATPLLNALGLQGLAGARLRGRGRRTWTGNRAGVPGQRPCRHLRRHRHGAERAGDRDPGAGAVALVKENARPE